MLKEDLNDFIYNYIKNTKHKSAIMLDGEWGIGKSFYIENELKDFIFEKDNKYNIITISLYGIDSTNDINKQLYVEIRTQKIKNTADKCIEKIADINIKEVKAGANLIGKTLLRTLLNWCNIETKLDDQDLQKLYTSINLENTLIIFEDLERAHIDIIEFLGYINNLIEDNVKILLVANEKEIIYKIYNYKDEDNESNLTIDNNKKENEANKSYSHKGKRYVRIKEKTVSDTLNFSIDIKEVLPNIVKMMIG